MLLLAAVAFAGPWLFERIHVPAQYACSPPTVRLEGDFCGTPFPGVFIFLTIIGAFFELVRALTLAELSRALQIFSVLLVLVLALLPLFTTLILVLSQGGRFKSQVVAWGVAAVCGPVFALIVVSRPRAALWGLWLYIALAVSALALELSALAADRKSGLARRAGR